MPLKVKFYLKKLEQISTDLILYFKLFTESECLKLNFLINFHFYVKIKFYAKKDCEIF